MDASILLSPVNIKELGALISSQIRAEISQHKTTSTPSPTFEPPIGFDDLLKLLGLKERTVRGKIAAGEIPHYQRGGKLYFFTSEIIEYIRTGKIKTNAELSEEAKDYIDAQRA